MNFLKSVFFLTIIALSVSCENKEQKETEYHQPDLTSFYTSQNIESLNNKSFYVPVYSEIYSSTEKMSIQLTVTLSIRNTSISKNSFVKSVDYYNSKGKKIRNYLSKPIELKPLQAIDFVVTEADKTGGTGANFIVKTAGENSPLLQGIMIGTLNQQGISYLTEAKEIETY
ncbi:Protein of unknown function [Pustulibacterium marinum]|uniref:DUF3124 domain-containing protein n=1 Tax=Pustulibacterium marinum TaxID=1224947 RepID=A0A1I7IL29_9FLAO|nr:DUF3124 domain-containing protein [Pustulibacterium marinum]SFU73595.1 Protein of unknown function [Pustulibacterium marinum]